MRNLHLLLALLLSPLGLVAQAPPPGSVLGGQSPRPPKAGPVVVHEARYDGQLTVKEARFAAALKVECTNSVATTLPLFQGDLAVVNPQLPEGLRLGRVPNGYQLVVEKPGKYDVALNLLARVKKSDPWKQIEFTGPAATIGVVTARVDGDGMELELLSGTPQPRAADARAEVRGALGADRKVALRWQTRVVKQVRPVRQVCQTASSVKLTPTVVEYSNTHQFSLGEGSPTNAVFQLAPGQKLVGTPVLTVANKPVELRGWDEADADLNLHFVKPITGDYQVHFRTEQPVPAEDSMNITVSAPMPNGVIRENCRVSLAWQDMREVTIIGNGMSKGNTPNAWVSSGTAARSLAIAMERIQPEITARDVITAELQENSLVVTHQLTLNIAKAGIYSIDLVPQANLMETSIDGPNIREEDSTDGTIRLEFAKRILGQQTVTVVLEEMYNELPESVTLKPLKVAGAVRQTAEVRVSAERGLEIRRGAGTSGLRDTSTANALGFAADSSEWALALTTRRLPPRVAARVSNSVVIGDNRVYGISRIVYAIADQGVREFHVRVPAAWEANGEKPEFLGDHPAEGDPVEVAGAPDGMVDHRIQLKEKAWDQYTLQIHYTLPLEKVLVMAGAHPLEPDKDGGLRPLERDTGTLIVHSASTVRLGEPETTLDRIDASELQAQERSRVPFPLIFAFQYDNAEPFTAKVTVDKYKEQPLLNSIANFTELTSVVTGNGQIATTATMTVQKTDKEDPFFRLPEGARFISCRIATEVDGQRVEQVVGPREEEGGLSFKLPAGADENREYEVRVSWFENHEPVKHDNLLAELQTHTLHLKGPETPGLPNTFNRWTVYVPESHEMFDYQGNMVPPAVERRSLADVLDKLGNFLERQVHWGLTTLAVMGSILGFVVLNVYLRRGWKTAAIVGGAVVGVLVLGGLILMGGIGAVQMKRDRHYSPGVTTYGYNSAEPGDDYSGGAEGEGGGDDMGGEDPEQTDASPSDPSSQPSRDGGGAKPNAASPEPGKPSPAGPPKTTQPNPPGVVPPRQPVPVSPTESGRSKTAPGRNYTAEGGQVPGERDGDTGTVSGVLPPEFEIPTDGRAYVFTKALNITGDNEAGADSRLVIHASIMSRPHHVVRTGIYQWLTALAGLAVLIWQWRRMERESGWITAGFALLIGGVGAFMHGQGTLHLLIVNLMWILPVAVYAWAVWFFWPAKRFTSEPPPPDDTPDKPDSGAAPAASAAAILFLGVAVSLQAAPGPAAPAGELQGLLRRLLDPEALPQLPGGPRAIRESHLQDRNGTAFEINADKPFTGQVVGFYHNKQRRIESHYQAGQRHGVEVAWFDNGQRQRTTQYANGRRHGLEATWFRSGQKSGEVQYQDGLRHGLTRQWHAGGKLAAETHYVKGEPHGLARQWHANGKIAREVRWENGRQLSFDTWTAEGQRMGPGADAVTLAAASYKLAVHREVARVEAEFKFTVREPRQKFTLFREVIALDEFTCTQEGAQLLREGAALVLSLPNAGEAVVKVKFLTKHAGTDAKRSLAFGIPPALTSKVDVTLEEADSEVEMPTAVTLESASGGNQTLVNAIIGASDRLELSWKPRVQKAREVAVSANVRNYTIISFSRGGVQARSILNYELEKGELREARLALPAGWTLMKVEGGKVLRNYAVTEENGQSVLVAQLNAGVTAKWPLTLNLERPLAAPPVGQPSSVPLSVVTALDVKQETGFVAVQSLGDLAHEVTTSTGLSKSDVTRFANASKLPVSTGASVLEYVQTGFELAAQVETILPELTAKAWHHLTLTEARATVTSTVAYEIEKVGVLQLRLALPAETSWRVASVNTVQWKETTEDGARILEVTLPKRTIDGQTIVVGLEQLQPAEPENFTMAVAHPLGIKELTSYVGVSTEPGLKAARDEAASSNLGIWAQDGSTSGFGSEPGLTYRYINKTPGDMPEWALAVNLTRLEPRVPNAQVVSHLRLGATRATGFSSILYKVENAPVRRFTVLLPQSFNTNHVRFLGQGIRSQTTRATDAGSLYTITLQNKVLPGSEYTLGVEWELSGWKVGEKGTLLDFRGPLVQGKNQPESLRAQLDAAGVNEHLDDLVRGETGWLVISDDARANLKLTTRGDAQSGLDRKDVNNLPTWAASLAAGARQVWFYPRPGNALSLDVSKLRDAAVEKTWITRADFTSVVTEDGQMMTRMVLEVNNNGSQFLRITLPGKDPRVLSVLVDRQARRPTKEGDQILVPLEQSIDLKDAANLSGAFTVEVTYTCHVQFPRKRGEVELESPKFSAKLDSARWWLYLPANHTYDDFRGTMDPTTLKQQIQSLTAQTKRQVDQVILDNTVLFESGERQEDEGQSFGDGQSSAGNNYTKGQYEQQKEANKRIAIDNLKEQIKKLERNLDVGNQAAANRYSSQVKQSINDLRSQVGGRGRMAQTDDQRFLSEIEKNFNENLEGRRRGQQLAQEQTAANTFAYYNNAPNNDDLTTANPNGFPLSGNNRGFGAGGQQGQGNIPSLSQEVTSRQQEQIEKIEDIAEAIATGQVTPLQITLPGEGTLLTFSQPLQTQTEEGGEMTQAMTVRFHSSNDRETHWVSVILWGVLALAILHFLVTLGRLALRRAAPATE